MNTNFLITLCFLFILSACKSEWTEEERTAFKRSCVHSVTDAADAWPKQTCDCLQAKLEKKYPNPNDMEGFMDSLRQNPVLLFDQNPECRQMPFETPADWTPASERAFINSCGTLVAQGEIPDTNICRCVLEKVKARYPTTQRMQRINGPIMQVIAEECEGKRPAKLW